MVNILAVDQSVLLMAIGNDLEQSDVSLFVLIWICIELYMLSCNVIRNIQDQWSALR